ncbi:MULTISPECIES: 2-hydroxy-3-oxopropionate reductase [unclassified Modicisalibacter]|uniref:2-hydroxy-3-oxopropionate reductase n=1 Tax=unclassified Modicisalibacter TaxID=2679913 RepID=UPI001CCF78F1|nr:MULTISPECIES: 2-hydroxy-3-oxopropionate reductase [unclassified Modicisalibacter]MBZ9558473.1 2-hydroxy-3-oxopropionate reductase [Modicisalibacter sp. R2A 31.J]MBZ9575635.1 2-hydroxy-3-oxopropionate reductase [Modicisalibacter sp. MOD 31.J]
MSKIGFIGLGIMGRPMAGHLLDAGHELVTVKRDKPLASELADKGMQELADPKAVAEASEVIITIVPDTPDVEEVLFGEGGVIGGLKPGTLVIDMSSIAPLATQDFAKRIEAAGGEYVDAPVSGGEGGAINAALTIMVGATQEGFARANPLLELMGKTITHIGGHGAGQTCKVANQIVVALTIEAVSEGLLFASKAGADVAKVRESLLGGLAQSKILDVHGERMIKRTFDPGFKIKLHQKDLNLALEGARSLNLALPGTANAQQLFQACAAHDGADWDHAGMVRALEALANHEIE